MVVDPTTDEATLLDLARRMVDIASDRQAVDVVLIDISDVSSFADYFVICTGTSERHLKAVSDTIVEELERDGYHALHVEGAPASGWVLIDFGAVIVHVFAEEERGFYRLEQLWSGGTTVVRVQ